MEVKEPCNGVYIMGIAARLTGMHPQTLRKYEKAGLLLPARQHGLRLYSDDDIARLRMIKHLVEEGGLNLAGLRLALDIRERLVELRKLLASMISTEDSPQQQVFSFLDETIQILETCTPAKAFRNKLVEGRRSNEHKQVH